MAGHRASRNAEDIKREIMSIIREMKDPRIRDGFLSVVRVEVSNDLSNCKVYISAMEGYDKAKAAVKILTSSSGYIRSELGARLSLRHVPSLMFKATDSIEYSANISRILNGLDIKDDSNNNDDSE